jgi:hypothetical protein
VAYQKLAEESKVPPLLCPIDKSMLYPNLTDQDQLFLYCLECSYKNYVGLDLYEKVERYIEKHYGKQNTEEWKTS